MSDLKALSQADFKRLEYAQDKVINEMLEKMPASPPKQRKPRKKGTKQRGKSPWHTQETF